MCGVFGAFTQNGGPVLEDVYLGLYALQHRGQESAGVAWVDDNNAIRTQKGNGLVHLALDQEALAKIDTRCAIGHVRYSTAGGSDPRNIQPLTASNSRGSVAVAHNGNITNAEALKQYLENRGAIFHSLTDTEVLLPLMAHQPHKPMIDAFVDSLRRLKGAYSLVMILDGKLVAARDPWGFRPLVIGQRDRIIYVSSETCALDLVGAKALREVAPGEVVVIDKDEIKSIRIPVQTKCHYQCSFEYVYFARPDSILAGRSVYAVRKALGHCLAKRAPCLSANMVTGMPDSGTIASMGFAEGSTLPYEKAIVRNRYVGRTFINPTQRVRELGVRIKLNPIHDLIKDRKIVVIDDSIVRGTTSQRIIAMIRAGGAKEVHVRISSPPVCFPCYYGIDTPSRVELAAARMNIKELEKIIGADSLEYITVDDLVQAIGLPRNELCTACFTGEYMEGETQDELEL